MPETRAKKLLGYSVDFHGEEINKNVSILTIPHEITIATQHILA